MPDTIGFIGVGTMGLPMVKNLLQAKFLVTVFDLNTAAAKDAVTAGATPAASAQDVATNTEIIITMLPDTSDVETVLFGENSICQGLTAGKLLIDMSSVSPEATVEFASRINALGCEYLDAPVSGGEVGAISGKMTIMVGGPEAAFNRAKPAFDAMGSTVTLIGTRNGDGQVCKVANQIIGGVMVNAVAEALLFADKAGADAAKVREALLGGAVRSFILENHGGRMLDRNFDPTFRANLQRKDLNLAIEACQKLNIVLPQATAAWETYNATIAGGDGDNDAISVLKTLERLAGHEIGELS
ncbi:MAG: NAD(P)-dependent oxidoreductase [Alphaproteobacteria bacterium]|nr:NAD(P)-dependent oxidoreductase [Alphaproteobacteria bacterium]